MSRSFKIATKIPHILWQLDGTGLYDEPFQETGDSSLERSQHSFGHKWIVHWTWNVGSIVSLFVVDIVVDVR
jgi:hypothetical protein